MKKVNDSCHLLGTNDKKECYIHSPNNDYVIKLLDTNEDIKENKIEQDEKNQKN